MTTKNICKTGQRNTIKNKEIIAEKKKARYEMNKEIIAEKKKAYRLANGDKIREQERKSKQRAKEASKSQSRVALGCDPLCLAI